MKKKRRNLLFLPISLFAITSLSFLGSIANAGSQGVDIYCVMRNGGNDHDSSWQAAYMAIKNERGGLFKISPKQAATIIVQQVVGNTDAYSDCIQYLGELYPKDEEIPDASAGQNKSKRNREYLDDRYSY